jgi:CRP-like cAMP-binding protein
VPLASLKAIGQADSDAIRRIGGQATQAMTLAASAAADLLIPQSAQRVAAVLLRVTAAEKGILPEHPDGFLLSQQLLAEMSNSSRNHVNQILGEFRAAGWVATRYNRIALTNVPKLLAFAYAE